MALGLPVSNVVNVEINMSPMAARTRDFGTMLALGTTEGVIDTGERIRLYSNLDEVANDFGTSAKEYLTAQLYFSQTPRPTRLYIGRWARTATKGSQAGAELLAAQQAMSNFTPITNGTMTIRIDATDVAMTAINFSAQSNLNGVASVISGKLNTAGTCIWDAPRNRFVITSASTGVNSIVAPAQDGAVAALMGLGLAQNPPPAVRGVAAETPVQCVQLCADKTNDWYGVMFCDMLLVTDDDHVAVAAYIEGADPVRIYGVGVQSSGAYDSQVTTDLGARLKTLGYGRTFSVFSSSQPLVPASVMGRAFTVNFNGSNTAITLKFKQLPGVAPETLTTSQANNLTNKHYNMFVNYANDTAILQEGVMCNGVFFDERHGLDWLQNDVQTRVYNRLYTGHTKVPQTDYGQTDLMTTVEGGLAQALENGLIAPGKWNADGFGQLQTGDMLPKGYYIYSAPMAQQSQSEREQRRAMPIQCAIKLAGAVHFVDVTLNVNR